MVTSEEIELQVLADIKDVFEAWHDDESSADEVDDGDADDAATSSLGIPPLRSETHLSKRTLDQAISALPSAPPAKRARGGPSAMFAPFSESDYLDRLSTFNLLNFSAAAFPPSVAARAGWTASGRDRLKCGCCQAAWKISDFTGLKGSGRDKLATKMRTLLTDNHRPSCPWRTIGTELLEKASSLLPAVAVKPLCMGEVRRRAHEMAPHLPSGLRLAHPLTDADLVLVETALCPQPPLPVRSSRPASSAPPPSSSPTSAGVLAVFHWQLLSTTSSRPSSQPAASPAPNNSTSDNTGAIGDPPSQTVLTCQYCSRRLGLWTFTPSKALPVDASHAPSCPSRALSVADRLTALAAPEASVPPNRRQVRELVQNLLGPKVTLAELRGWKSEVDALQQKGTADGRAVDAP